MNNIIKKELSEQKVKKINNKRNKPLPKVIL